MDKKAKIASIVSILAVFLIMIFIVFAAPKKCNNGADDDNDGLIDYPADPGCSSNGDNSETSTSLVCDNGVDQTNDRDTLADFRLSGGDPGCTSATDTSEIDGVCDDLDDETNDRDNLTDSTDPGCTSTSDTSEVDGPCDDLLDNDGDLLSDYPQDTGCTSFSDSSELGTAQCDDGTDNDSDTKADFGFSQTKDSKCSSSTDNDESPKDSCSDTDGGQISGTQGTVSGDDESVPYSLTDFCVDTVTLTEYYCGTKVQDYAPLNTSINCAMNQTTSCINGACV